MKYRTLSRMVEVFKYEKGIEDGFTEEFDVPMNPEQFNRMQVFATMHKSKVSYPYVENVFEGIKHREFLYEDCFIVKDEDGKFVFNQEQLDEFAEPVEVDDG